MVYASVQAISVTSTSFFKIDQINSWCRTTLPMIPEEKYQPIRNFQEKKNKISTDTHSHKTQQMSLNLTTLSNYYILM